MSDVPVFNQKIRNVSNDNLTRERLIAAHNQDQELSLLCSRSVTVQESEMVHVYFFIKDDVLIRIWHHISAYSLEQCFFKVG